MADLDILEIGEEQAQGAKLLASALSEPSIRKRGMIDMLGISCAVNYLHSKKFRIDTRKSVYRIPILFEEFKISDIYYGNYRIDVITLYKEKNIKIPKIHYEMDILPHFYFVVQIGAKIKEAKMIGFIDAKDIPKCSCDSKYYYPTLDMIFDCKKFSTLTRHSIVARTLLGKHIDCMALFLKYIDGDLSSVYKRQMIQHLMNCDSCRSRFIDAIEFEKLANNIKYYPELVKKYASKTKTKSLAIELTDKSKFATIEEGLSASGENVEIKTDVAVMERDDLDDIDDNSNIGEGGNFINDDKPKEIEVFDFSDKNNKNQLSTRVIETIFNGIPKFELGQIKTIANAKNRRTILVVFVVLFVFLSFALISIKGSSDNGMDENNMEAFEEPFEDDYDDEGSYGSGVARLIPKQRRMEDYSVMQPKISEPAYSPSINKIAWEAPESITKKDSYKKYLLMAGKNIKLNLQNDLLLVSDIPINKVVKLDIRVSADGDVESVKLTSSSGSDEIDASVKKVVRETLNYMKPPSHGIVSKPIDITLNAELN